MRDLLRANISRPFDRYRYEFLLRSMAGCRRFDECRMVIDGRDDPSRAMNPAKVINGVRVDFYGLDAISFRISPCTSPSAGTLALRSRLIEPLARARFPSGVVRAKVPLEWPSP
jgi:hypothetical protein